MQAAHYAEPKQQELAIATDSAVVLMQNLELITPGIFDYFLMVLMAWYQEESNHEQAAPNLYAIFEGSSMYSQTFFSIFIDGFAEQYCKHKGIPGPGSEGFEEHRASVSDLFMRNLGRLQGDMLHDFELVLDSMNMAYLWDSFDEEDDAFYKHYPIVEVW